MHRNNKQNSLFMSGEWSWRMMAVRCVVALSILLQGCDKPLRFPFRIYPSPTENTDSVLAPPEPEIIHNAATDYDGNVYDAVRIGDLLWLQQNMRTTHYADGTPIPNGIATPPQKTERAWPELHNGDCHISDSTAFYYEIPDADKKLYGLLYNWPAAVRGNAGKTYTGDVQGICPDGWHVPSNEEWDEMVRFLSQEPGFTCGEDSTYIARALAADTGWGVLENWRADAAESSNLLGAKKALQNKKKSPDFRSFTPGWKQEDNNATGFMATPAGRFTSGFCALGIEANFWTASRSHDVFVWYRYLNAGSPIVYKTYNSKDYGFSVRCVK